MPCDQRCEVWKAIPGYKGIYDVSTFGRVRSYYLGKGPHARLMKLPQKILRQSIDKQTGYPRVSLLSKKFRVHSLVALAFIGPRPCGKEVRHKDGNRLNSCLSNLGYATCVENNKDKLRHGTQPYGERHPNAKLTDARVRRARCMLAAGHRPVDVAAFFGVSSSIVLGIKHRRTWRHV